MRTLKSMLNERALKVELRFDSPAPNDEGEASDIRLGPLHNDFMRLYVAIMQILAILENKALITDNDIGEIDLIRYHIGDKDPKMALMDFFWGEVIRFLYQPAINKVSSGEYRLTLRRDWQLVLELKVKPAVVASQELVGF